MFDLMAFFITNFNIQTIYDAGWKAAQAWTVLVSGSILALAIAIRIVQEQFAGAKADYTKAIKDFLLYATLTASFFFFVYLLIEFFNALYGTLNASETMSKLGDTLTNVFAMWKKTKLKFSLSDLAAGFYGAFGWATFMLSYMALVFVVFGLRIAHAILVSTAAFWAAIAIPMAPINGLKSLAALKTIVLVAFIWPLFDAFFMFLVASVFVEGLQGAFDTTANTITASQMVFVLFIYSIINLFMIAAAISAPFISQGIANGTGNVTGMLASFGGAGLAAGALAAKYGANAANKAGAAAGKGSQSGANKLGGYLNEKAGLTHQMPQGNARAEFAKGGVGKGAGANFDNPLPTEKANGVDGSNGADGKSAAQNHISSAETTTPSASSKSTQSGANQPSGGQSQSNVTPEAGAAAKAAGGESTSSNASNGKAGEVASQAGGNQSQSNVTPEAGAAAKAAASKGMALDDAQTQIGIEQAQQADSQSGGDDESLAKDESRKDKQAKRGAIINQGKKK